MHALYHDQSYVPGENARKTALNAYSFSGNQRRSAALRIVLKGDLVQDAAWMGKVCSVKGPCNHFAVALVLQLFGDGIKPKGPKENQQEDEPQGLPPAHIASPL